MKEIATFILQPWKILFISFLVFFSVIAVTHSFDPTRMVDSKWSAVEEILFPKTSQDPFYSTDSLLIIKNGKTLYEKYWNGNTTETSHINWSISKSLSSLIVGGAVLRGDLLPTESLCKIAPKFRESLDCGMTVEHLLEWSSGLSFLESYEGGSDRTLSSVGQMLYGDGKKDSVSFVLGHKQLYPPGTHYYYSTGDSSVLLGILKYVYGEAGYKKLPHQFLFYPLEMGTAGFETDQTGHYLGGSSAYMSARDLAKVGQLVLNDGMWNGARVLPRGWIKYLTEINPQWTNPQDNEDKWIPLRQWWTPDLKALGLSQDPQFPKDIIAARGHWGQYLIIIPSLDMIIVRYGLDLEGRLDVLELIKRILKVAIPKESTQDVSVHSDSSEAGL